MNVAVFAVLLRLLRAVGVLREGSHIVIMGSPAAELLGYPQADVSAPRAHLPRLSVGLPLSSPTTSTNKHWPRRGSPNGEYADVTHPELAGCHQPVARELRLKHARLAGTDLVAFEQCLRRPAPGRAGPAHAPGGHDALFGRCQAADHHHLHHARGCARHPFASADYYKYVTQSACSWCTGRAPLQVCLAASTVTNSLRACLCPCAHSWKFTVVQSWTHVGSPGGMSSLAARGKEAAMLTDAALQGRRAL